MRKHKLLAILLTLALVITMLPSMALALDSEPVAKIGETEYSSWDDVKGVITETDTANAVVEILKAGTYTTNFSIPGGKTVTIQGNVEGVVLDGQIAALSSGTLTIKNVTYNVDEKIKDSTNISQTGSSGIAIWNNQDVICENVTFNMSLSDSTAITAWWSTNDGANITVKNCTFNCNGQRPIRSDASVTVEGCTFNDPYRYAVQMTSKASTITAEGNAVVNFNNNTINNGANGKAFVYGVQLEGETYGCSKLTINGSGNTIVAGTWDTENKSAMYYCECGIIQHDSIAWNTEVAPVHKNFAPVAEVNGIQYATLAAAITAAQAGDTVTLLADVSLNEVLLIGKSITIQGNGHKIENTANRVIRITAPDLDVKIYNCGIISKCTATSDVRGISFDNTSSGTSLTLDNCTVSAAFYAINVVVGPENLNITIKNGTVAGGWAALNTYCNNSTITIENSTMRGLNDKGEGGWNNFATLVFDGFGLNNDANIGKYGSNNTLTIKNSTVYSSSESSNNQAWLSLQYGATGNTVIVDSSSKLVDGSEASMIDNLCVYNALPAYGSRVDPIPYESNHLVSVQTSDETYRIWAPAGKQITLPAAPAKSGYTFAGWSDGTATYAAGMTYTMPTGGDTILTAQWIYIPPYVPPTNTNTETTTNPDGSTTTTTTDKTTGTVTETTTSKVTDPTAGTTTETKVETVTDATGAVTSTETVKTTDSTGTTGTTTTTTNSAGQTTVTAEATVTTAAVAEAAKNEVPVTLPVEVAATSTTATAPVVEIQVPATATEVKVEVPVENLTAGTVAVLVKPDGTEEIIKNTTMGENGVVVSLDGSATVKIVDNSKEFEDIHPVDHWSEESVDFVSSREIFNGTSDTTFDPEVDMTRGMMATVLARYDGADTTGGENWYDKGVEWAKENEISDGTNPTGKLTREEMAVMLYRYAGSPDADGELDFPDAGDVSDYAAAAMRWAVENGLINGMDGKLNPKGFATRAQLAAILMRFCQNVAN